jgi:hypothetical protein
MTLALWWSGQSQKVICRAVLHRLSKPRSSPGQGSYQHVQVGKCHLAPEAEVTCESTVQCVAAA